MQEPQPSQRVGALSEAKRWCNTYKERSLSDHRESRRVYVDPEYMTKHLSSTRSTDDRIEGSGGLHRH